VRREDLPQTVNVNTDYDGKIGLLFLDASQTGQRPPSPLGRQIESAAVDAAANQNRPFPRMIWGPHDTFLFHPLNQGRGFVVADGEAALDVACRAFSVAATDL
jgi:hypothetical protein